MNKIFKIIILLIMLIFIFTAGFLLGKTKNLKQQTEIVKQETIKSISQNLTDQGIIPIPAEKNPKMIQAQILEIKKDYLKIKIYPVTVEDILTNEQYNKNLKITDQTKIFEIKPNNQATEETTLTTKTEIKLSDLQEKNTITISLTKNWSADLEKLEAKEVFIYR